MQFCVAKVVKVVSSRDNIYTIQLLIGSARRNLCYVAFGGSSASAGCLLQFYQPGLSLSWAVGISLERFLAVFLDLKCQTCSVFHPWSKKTDLEKTKQMENYTGKSKIATVVLTHYLYLPLQFYRSLIISTSRITAMKSVGKNIIRRKYWRQIRTTTLWLQNKLLLGCHVIRLFVVWTNYTTSFFFTELLLEETSTHTFASVLGEKCCYQSRNKKPKRYWFYCDCMSFTFRLHNMLTYIICTSIPIHYNTSQAQCFCTEL